MAQRLVVTKEKVRKCGWTRQHTARRWRPKKSCPTTMRLINVCPRHFQWHMTRRSMSFSVFSFFHSQFSSAINMLQLTETTLFHWDLAFDFLYNRVSGMKKDFSGARTDLRKVQAWMTEMETSTPSLSRRGGSSASARSLASTLASTDVATSTGSQSSVNAIVSSSDGIRYRSSDAGANESSYCDAKVTHLKDTPRESPLVSDSSRLMQRGLLTHLAPTRTLSTRLQRHLQIKPLKIFLGSLRST